MQSSAMLIGEADLALAHATKVADHPLEYSQVLPGLFPIPRELVWTKFAMWNDVIASMAEGGPDQTFAGKFAQAVFEYASVLALASKGEATDAKAALRRLKVILIPPFSIFPTHSSLQHTSTRGGETKQSTFTDAPFSSI